MERYQLTERKALTNLVSHICFWSNGPAIQGLLNAACQITRLLQNRCFRKRFELNLTIALFHRSFALLASLRSAFLSGIGSQKIWICDETNSRPGGFYDNKLELLTETIIFYERLKQSKEREYKDCKSVSKRSFEHSTHLSRSFQRKISNGWSSSSPSTAVSPAPLVEKTDLILIQFLFQIVL